MFKSIIKFLHRVKCKIFICCGSKCSLNEDGELNINTNYNETEKTKISSSTSSFEQIQI